MQVWINADDTKNVTALAEALSKAVKANEGAQFKAFLIFLTPKDTEPAAFGEKLAKMAAEKKIDNIGIATISPEDRALRAYKINAEEAVKSTVIVYKNKTVTSKLINLKADDKGLEKLQAAIAEVTK